MVHIDEHAIAAVGEYFARKLPENGVILDLMSSWRSHLPEGFSTEKLVGLGLNATEMAENPQLDEWYVHDLNADPVLPFEDGSFDAAVVTVSIQYMVKPVEVFSQVNRVLKDCRWSTIMSVVNRSGKMSVHERIDIDPERTGKAPSAQRYPGRSDISG